MQEKRYSIAENNGVKFIQFNHIKEAGFPHHGFSTRIGGVSKSPYNTMNLGFTTEDNIENVRENQKRFLEALGVKGVEISHLIRLVHGNLVISYEELSSKDIPFEADGIITSQKNIPLVTTFADCVPIIIADPQKNITGVIHAGWRGTVASIASKAVDKMVEVYGCKLENILAGIGPGIGFDMFEVGNDVISMFLDKYSKWEDLTTRISNTDKWKLDLLQLNRRILLDRGIPDRNIVIADLCTYKRNDLFFSYRRDGKRSGRMAAVIVQR